MNTQKRWCLEDGQKGFARLWTNSSLETVAWALRETAAPVEVDHTLDQEGILTLRIGIHEISLQFERGAVVEPPAAAAARPQKYVDVDEATDIHEALFRYEPAFGRSTAALPGAE